MKGAVSWEALILIVAAIWFVGIAVAYVVWQLCKVVAEIHARLTRLEERMRGKP